MMRTNRNEAKEISKGLIVGCGHGLQFPGCEFRHPKSDFYTLDIRSKISTDIVADCESKNLLETIQKKIGTSTKLSVIVFENFPLNDYKLVNKLENLLEDKGKIVVVGDTIGTLRHLENEDNIITLVRKP